MRDMVALPESKETNYMKRESPLKAIRLKCFDCSGGSANEVKLCPVTNCELYPFRFGKNPNRKPPTDEQREKMRERFKNRFLVNCPR